jgi:hypothetical protein
MIYKGKTRRYGSISPKKYVKDPSKTLQIPFNRAKSMKYKEKYYKG